MLTLLPIIMLIVIIQHFYEYVLCILSLIHSVSYSILLICLRIGIVIPVFIDEENELTGSKACPKSDS